MKRTLWGVVLVVFCGLTGRPLLGVGGKDTVYPRSTPVELVTQGNRLELDYPKELIEKVVNEKLQDLGMRPPTVLEKVFASLPSAKSLLLLTASGVALTYIWKFRYWASAQDLEDSDVKKQETLTGQVASINKNFGEKSDTTNKDLTEIKDGATQNLTDLKTYVTTVQNTTSNNEKAIQKQQTAIGTTMATLKQEVSIAQNSQKEKLGNLMGFLEKNSQIFADKKNEFGLDLQSFLNEQKRSHKNRSEEHYQKVNLCQERIQNFTDPEMVKNLVGNLKRITEKITFLDGKFAISAQNLENTAEKSKNTTEQLRQQLEEEKELSGAIEQIQLGVFTDVKKTLIALKEISKVSIETTEKSVPDNKGPGKSKTSVTPTKANILAFKPASFETSNPSEKHKNQNSSAVVKKNSPTQIKYIEGSGFANNQDNQD
jgi:hypothetical protein